MNARTDPRALRSSTAAAAAVQVPAPVHFTQKQLLKIAIDALKAKGEQAVFATIRGIEDMDLGTFAGQSVAGTPYEPIAIALNTHGVPTEMSLGDVMTSLYPDLTMKEHQDRAHGHICYCHEESDVVAGSTVVTHLENELKAL